jgi:hypothetical protein
MLKTTATKDSLAAIRVDAFDLSLTVIPALGAKISSLTWQGREVLMRNALKPFRLAAYGSDYVAYDASGFDECFPTIGPCTYPEVSFQGVILPDHGELWSQSWQRGDAEDALYLYVDGMSLPYRFHRWIQIPAPGCVHFLYQVENLSDTPFKCLWSAHPLLDLRPGMSIHLPAATRVRVDWSRDGRLGNLLAEHAWPHTRDSQGNPVDLSQILPPSAGLVDKLYTNRLDEGWCALYDPGDGFYVVMTFSPHQIPYVGLSINLGGWPVDGTGYYNLGLEPCNGYPDRLDIAIKDGDCMVLPPRDQARWSWRLFVGRTMTLDAEIEQLRGQFED